MPGDIGQMSKMVHLFVKVTVQEKLGVFSCVPFVSAKAEVLLAGGPLSKLIKEHHPRLLKE